MDEPIASNIETLLWEYKDIFAWNYIDLKGIPPWIVQHYIKLDTTIPPTHQPKYRMNPNYVTIIKQDLDKLLSAGLITSMEEANCISPIKLLYRKKTASFISTWIFNDAMLLLRKIRILYLLQNRCWTKWLDMRSIFFGWIFKLSPDHGHPQRSVQDCMHHQLGSFRLGSHAIWHQECSTNLSMNSRYNFQGLSWNIHEIIFGWFQCVQRSKH